MTLARGDVHLVRFKFPDRERVGQFQQKDKYLVVLRSDHSTDAPFVIASTRRPDYMPRAFDVVVQPEGGQFSVETVIDCRWPYTLPKTWFPEGSLRFTLPPSVMRAISLALVVGLEISL